MDSDSWARLSTSSRRYQFRSDPFNGGEEMERDEESRPEFLCPFCAEDFDMVGLCCHIDEEHMVEAMNGVCPVCAKKRKRRFRKSGSNSTLSILRKELRDGNLKSLLGGSACLVSSTNTEADPLLSSFIYNPPVNDEPTSLLSHSSEEACSVEDNLVEDSSERNIQQPLLFDKDQEEKARKCEFVQGLLLSTFLDDNL